jgi:hypothetical protein
MGPWGSKSATNPALVRARRHGGLGPVTMAGLLTVYAVTACGGEVTGDVAVVAKGGTNELVLAAPGGGHATGGRATMAIGGTSTVGQGGLSATGGATGGSNASGTGGATICPNGQALCGSSCVELQTDPTNCGACGTACSPDRTCTLGRCTLVCAPGTADCGGTTCVNLKDDVNNCGRCGIACGTHSCVNGACFPCAAGQTPCGSVCPDLETDALNCGACGTACPADYMCVDGQCRLNCAVTRWAACGWGTCLDLQNDVNNCGSCGNACNAATGEVCNGGVCGCPSGWMDCAGVCVDAQADPANCGGCGVSCGTQPCTNGQCPPCADWLTLCGGSCVSTQVDPLNCGACGNVCPSSEVCRWGGCHLDCTPFSESNCDQSECLPVYGSTSVGGPGNVFAACVSLYGTCTDSPTCLYPVGHPESCLWFSAICIHSADWTDDFGCTIPGCPHY